jgi:ABC-type glycerol-3-phosphate transport system permease component
MTASPTIREQLRRASRNVFPWLQHLLRKKTKMPLQIPSRSRKSRFPIQVMVAIAVAVTVLASAYRPDYGRIRIANVAARLPAILVFFLRQRRFVACMLGAVNQVIWHKRILT